MSSIIIIIVITIITTIVIIINTIIIIIIINILKVCPYGIHRVSEILMQFIVQVYTRGIDLSYLTAMVALFLLSVLLEKTQSPSNEFHE